MQEAGFPTLALHYLNEAIKERTFLIVFSFIAGSNVSCFQYVFLALSG